MPTPPLIVGFGEALFDVFDAGPRLGGAPLNVAAHAAALLKPHGGAAAVVSAVGDDDLGQQLRQEADDLGVDLTHLQTTPSHPTGRVDVDQHDDGSHTFRIAPDSAWDHIRWTDALDALAHQASAIAFGTLAQRHGETRGTLRAFLAATPRETIKLFDVNLRSSDGKNFYDALVLTAGCHAADYVKLNDEELDTVCKLTASADADDLRRRFDLKAIIFTRGADGTAAYTADGPIEGAPGSFDPVNGADTVGAGDATTAGLLAALVLGRDLEQALDLANQMGAHVAGQVGATPDLPERILSLLDATGS